jgi:hypothetical protein
VKGQGITAKAVNDALDKHSSGLQDIKKLIGGAQRTVQNWRNLLGGVESELDAIVPPVTYSKCSADVETTAEVAN